MQPDSTVPDRDLGNSAVPARPLEPLVPLHQALADVVTGQPSGVADALAGVDRLVSQARRDGALEVLRSIERALDLALDPQQPHRSVARGISVRAAVLAATMGDLARSDPAAFLVSHLGQLIQSWQGGDAA